MTCLSFTTLIASRYAHTTKHYSFTSRFFSVFLVPQLNSGNCVVQEEIKTTDKTIETFLKKKEGGVNLNRIWKQQKQQMHCQTAGEKRENMSRRCGFYLYISCACQHQTFNVSVLQRRRRKEARCEPHIVITQSNSHPLLQTACSSAQLAPDTHIIIKQFLLMPRLRTDAQKTIIMRRLIGRPDSGKMKAGSDNSCRGLWLKKAADIRLNCG